MNEPKRRGRPPKARVEGADVGGEHVRLIKSVLTGEEPESSPAQAYARRVWAGQTPDLPRNERLKRVAKALEGQGLSMEGVELP